MDLPTGYSQRFTYGWAECSVVGEMTPGGYLDMNRRVVPPNAEVHTPSPETISSLFFSEDPSHLPIGSINTFGEDTSDRITITVDGDSMATKHYCVFGQTGTGKTNTSAKIIEEYLARGHRTLIFDPHDDYEGIDRYSNLLFDRDLDQEYSLSAPDRYRSVIESALDQLDVNPTRGYSDDRTVFERLIRTASIIHGNVPARSFLQYQDQPPVHDGFDEDLVNVVINNETLRNLVERRQVRSRSIFPEIRYYESLGAGFSIQLLQAFRGSEFSDAQWEWLSTNVNQNGNGLDYLDNLEASARSDFNNPNVYDGTLRVILRSINGIRRAYRDATGVGNEAVDLESLMGNIVDINGCRSESVYRISLSDLSSNLRKATVFGIIEYFFRRFKYGGYRVRSTEERSANAHPLLFVLEEARSLIPSSPASEVEDTSGDLARRAMRKIAYEGRKFSLGYGIISQKPSTVDKEVTSQSNTFILHQLKSPDDQQYVRDVTESMSEEELEMISELGTGRALVSGLAIKSPVLLDVFFRYSAEGVEAPTPIQDTISDDVMDARARLESSENAEEANEGN